MAANKKHQGNIKCFLRFLKSLLKSFLRKFNNKLGLSWVKLRNSWPNFNRNINLVGCYSFMTRKYEKWNEKNLLTVHVKKEKMDIFKLKGGGDPTNHLIYLHLNYIPLKLIIIWYTCTWLTSRCGIFLGNIFSINIEKWLKPSSFFYISWQNYQKHIWFLLVTDTKLSKLCTQLVRSLSKKCL